MASGPGVPTSGFSQELPSHPKPRYGTCAFGFSRLQQHAARVLDVLLDLDKESDGLPTIEESVVVGESDNHDGSDDDLAVDDDRLVLDGMHTEDGGLRKVDDRCTI